ncbi:hypothetical protein [Mycoplasmopsis canis]|uniref:hypothetical protein n=1 Tax=Mycoplasmopsis canis TaxID=29555 RepID=UPI00025ADC70|nr:hypothetical protein [Mycoplasmopsis canis]EIE41138.1 hypothetical protein MCANUF33_00115 [Mycoplasmopsis canis UF33]WQQ12650.1 hypothetical protein RRG48_01215 [Mycoplasmopsis canis]
MDKEKKLLEISFGNRKQIKILFWGILFLLLAIPLLKNNKIGSVIFFILFISRLITYFRVKKNKEFALLTDKSISGNIIVKRKRKYEFENFLINLNQITSISMYKNTIYIQYKSNEFYSEKKEIQLDDVKSAYFVKEQLEIAKDLFGL